MGRSFADRALAFLLAHRQGVREGTLAYEFLGYERTLIADARPGEMMRVQGRVVADGPRLTAPLTGVPCVWYRTTVYPCDGVVYRLKAIGEEQGSSILVDDGSGLARVSMRKARFSLKDMELEWSHEPPRTGDEQRPATADSVRAFLLAHGVKLADGRNGSLAKRMLSAWSGTETHGARYRELVLREGERVAVLGEIVHEPDPGTHAPRQPALRIAFGEVPSGVIVSNESPARAG